jgi:hypothetical protein
MNAVTARGQWRIAAGLSGAFLVAAAILSPPGGVSFLSEAAAAGAALTCGSEDGWGDVGGWPDFDEDCGAELAVGAPGWDVGAAEDAGAVQYLDDYRSDSDSRMITAQTLGFVSDPGARFGSTMVAMEVDGEPPMDLVIGAPGQPVEGVASAGAVYVVFGSLPGLGLGRPAVRLTASSLGLSSTGGRFGTSLASWPALLSGQRQLAVGEPLATVDGKQRAGRLVEINVSSLKLNRVISQGHGTPGKAEAGDRFAASLSIVEDYGDEYELVPIALLVGSPDEDVGTVADAGAVTVIEPGRSWMVSQDSPHFPGKAERGDHFGAAVTGINGQPFGDETYAGALIAAPGEDLGRARDAGALVMLDLKADMEGHMSWSPFGRLITANSPGFPGVPETGDRLGGTLAGELVGVPYEDIGKIKDAGAVCMIDLGSITAAGRVPTKCFDQNRPDVPGVSEAGDHFGQALTTIFEGADDDPPMDLVIGVPGEDVGATKDRGGVILAEVPYGPTIDWSEPPWSLPAPNAQKGGTLGAALPQ